MILQNRKEERWDRQAADLSIEVTMWQRHDMEVTYTEWTQHGDHCVVDTGQGKETLEKDGRSSEFPREHTTTLASIKEKRKTRRNRKSHTTIRNRKSLPTSGSSKRNAP